MTEPAQTATTSTPRPESATLVTFPDDDRCGSSFVILDGVIDEGALVPCPDGDHDHRAAATLPLVAGPLVARVEVAA